MSEARPVTRARTGFVLHLGRDERVLVARLLDELRTLLTEPADPALVRRLFPVVHPDDPAREAEYQRLTRQELVASRVAGIDAVSEVLGRGGRKVSLDDDEMAAFVQAVNGVRLVLGTLLDVQEDDAIDVDLDERHDSPEYHLYDYLSWLLESAVHALSPTP